MTIQDQGKLFKLLHIPRSILNLADHIGFRPIIFILFGRQEKDKFVNEAEDAKRGKELGYTVSYLAYQTDGEDNSRQEWHGVVNHLQ